LTLGRWAVVVTVLVVTTGTVGVVSASAAWTNVAIWQMNEDGPNAPFMLDSSGKGRSGKIGNSVITGVTGVGLVGPNKAYQWPNTGGGFDPERLVYVNRRTMNPFRDAFRVTIRMRTSVSDGNILQKGQATTSGGMWKIELTNGRVFCTFKGSAGRRAIGSAAAVAVSNDQWHTVQCTRWRTGVTIVVDGGIPRTQHGRTGNIDNSRPLTIGGKLTCNPPPQGNVSCQYYVGLLDRVAIRRR
jgi:Laminin G domain